MLKRVFGVLGVVVVWIIAVSVLWVLILRVVPPPVTWIMAQQSNEQGSVKRAWKSLDMISHTMPLAIIAAEDQKFFDHFGFDWEAMRHAMKFNDRKKGRMVKGASTISQQTAKNVFCWPGRTFLRKGCEAWFTLLIECLWSKNRIIEVYMNVAETGKGRFGVEATSQGCFGRPSSRIGSAEAALIAAALPLPRKFNACSPSGYLTRREAWIQNQMNHSGDLFDPQVRYRINEEMKRKQLRSAGRERK